jgi:hypothetical protein
VPLYWRERAGLQSGRHLTQPRFTNRIIILTLRIDHEPMANCGFARMDIAVSYSRGCGEWVLASRESTLHDVMVQQEQEQE